MLTVRELLEECEKQIANGNGNKKIYISKDDEGNSFHPLHYGFEELTEENEDEFDTWNGEELDHNEHIILG